MGCILRRRRRVPCFAGLVLEGLRCFLAGLSGDCYFLRILVALLRFVCLLLLLVALRMLCNLLLRALIRASHRRTLSVYDKVR
jgi:hypothetical protein